MSVRFIVCGNKKGIRRKDMKRLTALLLAGIMTVSLGAYSAPVFAEEAEETLVYGSGDYTRINPAMDEH